MINLLPDNDKKLILSEYKLRIVLVGCMFILSVILLALILLTPSYFLASYRERAAGLKAGVALTPEQTKERQELDASLQSAKLIITTLAPDAAQFVPSHIIDAIIHDKGSSNIVTEIIYSQHDGASFTITIRGTAATRESLLDFSTALKKESVITEVVLPVSNFAKNTNIDFSIDITGTQKQQQLP